MEHGIQFNSREELAQKIDWEGGILESVEYGITVKMLPEDDAELIDAWRDLVKAMEAVEPAKARVAELLEDWL